MKRSIWGGLLALSVLPFAGCQSITSTTDVSGDGPFLPPTATMAADDGMVVMADGSAPQISVDVTSCADVTSARSLVHLFVNDEVNLALACMRDAAGTRASHPRDGVWEWRVHATVTVEGHARLFAGVLKAQRTETGWGYTLLVSGELRDHVLVNFRLMTGSCNSDGTGGSWVIRDVRYTDDRTVITVNWNKERTDDGNGNAVFTLSHELVSGSTMTTSRVGGMVTYDITLTGAAGGFVEGHYTVSVNAATHAGTMTGPDGVQHCWNGSGECSGCTG